MENQEHKFLTDSECLHMEDTEFEILPASKATSKFFDENIDNNDIIEDINRIQQALYSLSSIDTADDFNELFERIYR